MVSSQHTDWARPLTLTYAVLLFLAGSSHFIFMHWKVSWQSYRDASMVRSASATSHPHVSQEVLLIARCAIFAWCAWLLVTSLVAERGRALHFFTVWNFIALTVFFGLGTALSCSCCRRVAQLEHHWQVPASHRLLAALHRALFEVLLPMSILVAVVVWLVIFPYDVQIGDAGQLARDLGATSLSMHALNVLAMLAEFCLDRLLLDPRNFGLLLSWAAAYCLFDGMQPAPTYFFMDFSLAKTPLVALGLTAVLLLVFGGCALLSDAKARLMAHADPPPLDDDEEGSEESGFSPRGAGLGRCGSGEWSAASTRAPSKSSAATDYALFLGK
jgi:hypothetical protein